MHVAALRLVLRTASCPSVRRRHRLMTAIIDKLRRHFNISAIEDERLTTATEAALLITTVARTRREAHETLQRVANAVSVHPLADLLVREIHDL
jgi:uncharacterized protein YlxP (DUF503 family)